MSAHKVSELLIRRPMLAAVMCALLGAVCIAIADDNVSGDVVTSSSEFKFGKEKPLGTLLVSGITLRKDSQTGGLSALVKHTKGTTTKHFHTFTEEVVLLKGTMIHFQERLPETRTKNLEVGSYWYIPAGSVHQETCLTDECILFVLVGGKGETKVVEE